MLLFLQIDTTRPIDVSIRAWRDISRAGMMAVGQYWDERLKMGHFTPEAEGKYGYKQRSERYLKRKRRGRVKVGKNVYSVPDGGNSPIVFKGDTRADLRPRQWPEAFPTRVAIRMTPRGSYVQMKPDPRKRDAPNLGEELTRVTPGENQLLAKVYQDTVTPLLVQYREQGSRRF